MDQRAIESRVVGVDIADSIAVVRLEVANVSGKLAGSGVRMSELFTFAQYGAWRAGSHDDLALAMALACWRAKGDERVVGDVGDGRLV